jgi:hypothetical protein
MKWSFLERREEWTTFVQRFCFSLSEAALPFSENQNKGW